MRRTLLSILAFATALSSEAHACAVCMADPTSNVAEASNGVFILLLGLVAVMFTVTLGVGYFLWRKSHAPIPEHIQLVESLTDETA